MVVHFQYGNGIYLRSALVALTGRHYLVVADPWADHGAEFGELLAAVLSGGFEIGPTKPGDLRLDTLDEALAAARE